MSIIKNESCISKEKESILIDNQFNYKKIPYILCIIFGIMFIILDFMYSRRSYSTYIGLLLIIMPLFNSINNIINCIYNKKNTN